MALATCRLLAGQRRAYPSLRVLVRLQLFGLVFVLVAGCGSARSTSTPPPGPDASPVSLWLSSTHVPPDDVEVEAVFINRSGVTATFGVAASIDRWDGSAWEPYRKLVMCLEDWHCTAHARPAGEKLPVPAIGLGAAPARPGPLERFSTHGLQVGWYRVTQTANDGQVAAAIFEVAADAQNPAPLVPLDKATISVMPALVPSHGGKVTLRTLVPAPTGVQSIGDVQAAAAGLSDTAAIERWEDDGWSPVAQVALPPAGPGESSTSRSAELPALSDGMYRISRTGPSGTHEGRFWVDSDAQQTSRTSPHADGSRKPVRPVARPAVAWSAHTADFVAERVGSYDGFSESVKCCAGLPGSASTPAAGTCLRRP